MTPVIEAWATFHNATPGDLYELFHGFSQTFRRNRHAAKVSRKVGGKWSAFGEYFWGRTLHLFRTARSRRCAFVAWKKV